MDLNQIVRMQSAKIDELQATITRQQAQIDRQSSEITDLVAFIEGDKDSLSVLQSLYLSPTASESMKLKASAAALPFERSRPPTATINLNIAERIDASRLVAQGRPAPSLVSPQLHSWTNSCRLGARIDKPPADGPIIDNEPALASDNAGEAAEGPDAA
jgi:hypothetical protein